jgi:hypothetical protein
VIINILMFSIDFENSQQSNPFALVALFVIIAVIIVIGIYVYLKSKSRKDVIL